MSGNEPTTLTEFRSTSPVREKSLTTRFLRLFGAKGSSSSQTVTVVPVNAKDSSNSSNSVTVFQTTTARDHDGFVKTTTTTTTVRTNESGSTTSTSFSVSSQNQSNSPSTPSAVQFAPISDRPDLMKPPAISPATSSDSLGFDGQAILRTATPPLILNNRSRSSSAAATGSSSARGSPIPKHMYPPHTHPTRKRSTIPHVGMPQQYQRIALPSHVLSGVGGVAALQQATETSLLRTKALKKPELFAEQMYVGEEPKTCFECQRVFTVWKRKHYCRMCGHLVCDRCCDNFVAGDCLGYCGHVRVCVFCYDVITSTAPVPPPRPLPGVQEADQWQILQLQLQPSQPPFMLRSALLSGAPDRVTYTSSNPEGKPAKAVSATAKEDAEEKIKEEAEREKEKKKKHLQLQKEKEHKDKDKLHHQTRRDSTSSMSVTPRAKRPVIDGFSVAQVSSIASGSPCGSPVLSSLPESLTAIESDDSHTPPSLPPSSSPRHDASETSHFQDLTDVPDPDRHRSHLEAAAEQHLNALIGQMIGDEEIDPKWQDTIVDLAWQVAHTVDPQVSRGDRMDLRSYVQVKKIPCLSEADEGCAYVDGVVCRKNMAHKKMSSHVKDPWVLLLNCALELEHLRVEGQVSTVEALLQQEQESLKRMAANIVALKPNVVLVSKSVARVVQDVLLQEGITLVLNVKDSVMDRVARSCQAEIQTSTDHLRSTALGTCSDFRIESVSGKWGAKTLMYFDGCSSSKGCTINVRGPNLETLEKVKRVLQFAIFVAHNLLLETAYLLDMGGTLPPSEENQPSQTTSDPTAQDSVSQELTSPALEKYKTQHPGHDLSKLPILSASLGVELHLPPRFMPHFSLSEMQVQILEQQQMEKERAEKSGGSARSDGSCSPRPKLAVQSAMPPAIGSGHSKVQGDASPHIGVLSVVNDANAEAVLNDGTLMDEISAGQRIPFSEDQFYSDITRAICTPLPFTFSTYTYMSTSSSQQQLSENVDAEGVISLTRGQTALFCNTKGDKETAFSSVSQVLTVPETGTHVAFIISDPDCAGEVGVGGAVETGASGPDPAEYQSLAEDSIEGDPNDANGGGGEMTCTNEGDEDGKMDSKTSPLKRQEPEIDYSHLLSPYNHQSIVVLYQRMDADQKEVAPPDLIAVSYYNDDMTLGYFLERNCFKIISDQPHDHVDEAKLVESAIAEIFGDVPAAAQKSSNPTNSKQNSNSQLAEKQQSSSQPQVGGGGLTTAQATAAVTIPGSQLGNQTSGTTPTTSTSIGWVDVQDQQIRSYSHEHGRLSVVVDVIEKNVSDTDNIMMWCFCKKCKQVVSPLTPMSDRCWKYSFGKFLEMSFHSFRIVSQNMQCGHSVHRDLVRSFSYKNVITSFVYEDIQIFNIVSPMQLLRHHDSVLGHCLKEQGKNLKELMEEAYTEITTKLEAVKQDRDYAALFDEIISLAGSLARQHSSMKQEIENVEQSSNIYDYNVMLRNLSSNVIGWNSILEDLYNEMLTRATTAPPLSARQHYQPQGSSSKNGPGTPSRHHAAIHSRTQSAPVHLLPFATSLSLQLQQAQMYGLSSSCVNPEHLSEVFVAAERSEQPSQEQKDIGSILPSSTNFSQTETVENSGGEKDEQQSHKKRQSVRLEEGVEMILPENENENNVPQTCGSQQMGGTSVEQTSPTTLLPPTTTSTPAVSGSGNNESALSRGSRTSLDPASTNIAAAMTDKFFSPPSPRSSSVAYPRTGASPPSGPPESGGDGGSQSQKAPSAAEKLEQSAKTALANRRKKAKAYQISIPTALWSPTTHLFLPSALDTVSVIVSEQDPISVVAYTLSSAEYCNQITPSLTTRRDMPWSELERMMRMPEPGHTKYKFPEKMEEDDKSQFLVTVYFPQQFAAFRKFCCDGDDSFIRSLVRSKNWKPTGGKSGSDFLKSWDERFVMKQISDVELEAFLKFAPNYFDYMSQTFFHQRPSVLIKILGVYRVGHRTSSSSRFAKRDIIIMENLFYDKKITRTFDLKGSVRNRYQTKSDAVQMDENLLEFIYEGQSLRTTESDKILLRASIFNDTLFLSKLYVMDYSLLVGVDEENGHLIVGIIDYLRQYTWDKQLETWVKSAGIMGGRGKIPTVISPRLYRARFSESMERYFLMIPDKFTGLDHRPQHREGKSKENKEQAL